MRDRVMIELGGTEYPMLPTFEVWDAFEDEAQMSLLEHLHNLNACRALGDTRARLILLGIKAGDANADFKHQAVKKRMFERGVWHESLVKTETEFGMRLLYTPEQFIEKKRELEEAAKAEAAAMAEFGAFSNISS